MESYGSTRKTKSQSSRKGSGKAKKKAKSTHQIQPPNDDFLRARGHHYKVQTIQLSVQQVIEAGNSYRGVGTTMELLSQSFSIESPHYSSIRKWLGRIGLFELQRKKERREDWIFIVDLTLELGQKKALVVYGITEKLWQEKVLEEERGLRHNDGEILEIEVTASATGERIEKTLEQLTQQVGIPRQIVADRGSNLKKGIELYQEKYPEVIYTYDVTHGMSNLLKKELDSAQEYQNFLADCHQCRQELQQTELDFLMPPSQRSQCRYFNVERLVTWARNLLDFPLALFFNLVPSIEFERLKKRLKDKFAWLINYQNSLFLWQKMVQMTRSLEKQLKLLGLSQQSESQFLGNLSNLGIPNELEPFKQKILDYLKGEINRLENDRTLLATSDVLESIFSKYKRFSARCPLKDFRQMLLTIPLSTMNLTCDVVKQALETVSGTDLEQWLRQIFGQSTLSKRKAVFSPFISDMKTA